MARYFLRCIILFGLLLTTAGVSAEDTNLVQFAEEHGFFFQWDPYRETGMLSRSGKIVSFKVNEPWAFVDFRTKLRIPAVYKKAGGLFIPNDAKAAMKEIFILPGSSDTPRIAAVFLDPGHGGKDPGTLGRHTIDGKEFVLAEKDVVLQCSRELADLLKYRYPDKKIILSRNDDRYLTLEERPDLANSIALKENEAIIFISIHANASMNSKAKGFEVWYLPPSYRRNLLPPEKSREDHKEILPILNTMLEEEFTVESILLAKHILKGLDAELGRETENRGLKDETWFVVRKAKMPSVLIEIGFVTNPEEARLLADRKYLKRIAAAVYNGLVKFIESFERPLAKGNSSR